MKKKEKIFIGALLLLSALGALLTLWLMKRGEGGESWIVITVDGEVFGEYDLSKDQTIEIGEGNTCVIGDGSARMTKADCPDHLCMQMKAVSGEGDVIVCLPNRVVIEGHGQKKASGPYGDLDAAL